MKATLPESPLSTLLIMLPLDTGGISLVRISENLSLNSSHACVQMLLNQLSKNANDECLYSNTYMLKISRHNNEKSLISPH